MKSTRKPIDVVGIVQSPGSIGEMSGNRWAIRFSLKPWHEAAGDVDDRKLAIRQKGLSERLIAKLTGEILPNYIVHVRVRFPARLTDPPTAEMVKFVGILRSNNKLTKGAKVPKRPSAAAHPYFGKFKFERDMNWYVTNYRWNGKKIELCLPLDDCKDEDAFFRLAEKLCKQQKKWDRVIREFAADELLERKNNEWRDEDDEIITRSEFIKRIKLDAITLYPDGYFGFTFDDGDIFWGHLIEVEGSMKDGPEDVSIEG